eukprot:g7931.t1
MRRIDIVLAESRDLNVNSKKTTQLMTVLRSVPLILMLDTDAPGAIFHGLKIGAVDFLKRPLDESKVQSMWTHTLHKRLKSVNTTAAPEEGPSSSVHRTLTPTDGSSNETKAPTPRSPRGTGLSPVQKQPDQRSTIFPFNAAHIPSQVSAPRQDPQKRRMSNTGDESRRRIRPNLTNQDHAIPSTNNEISIAANAPPLLGIPPGCVPPMDSEGLAIGMPFLNQHPFVPSMPMDFNSTLSNPFLFGLGNQQPTVVMQRNQTADTDEVRAVAQFPVFPTQSMEMPATSLGLPTNTSPLQRADSMPNTTISTTAPAAVPAAANLAVSDTSPDLLLRKSPSLVNM